MNEITSQVIGGAVNQLQVLDSFIFERLPCLHGNLDSVVGKMMVVKIEPTNRHDIHAMAIYSESEIYAMFLTINVSIFYEREQSVCRNHRSQSQ